MRRVLALVLVGLGVFLAVVAVTFKVYVEPRVVKLPLDQSGQSISRSDGASKVLDQGTLTVRENLTLNARREVRGDVELARASGRDQDVAVWRTTNILTDTQGNVVSEVKEVLALDRVTAEAVDCCGQEVAGDTSVTHEGLMLKFPFDTRKGSYQYWDTTALRAFPIEFARTEERDGVEVYHFVQRIPETTLRQAQVPGSLVGADPDELVDATVVYTNTREIWVEPTSGIIVEGREQPRQTLKDGAGLNLLTIFEANIGWTDETMASALGDAKDARSQLNLLRTVVPGVAGILGIGLFVLGLVLLGAGSRGGRRVLTPGTMPDDTVDLTAAEARERGRR